MEKTAHRTRVLYLGNETYAATCSCGYTTAETKDKQEAQVEANKHFYTSRRPAPDPAQLELNTPAAIPPEVAAKAPPRHVKL